LAALLPARFNGIRPHSFLRGKVAFALSLPHPSPRLDATNSFAIDDDVRTQALKGPQRWRQFTYAASFKVR
jgi:hypothetical protein